MRLGARRGLPGTTRGRRCRDDQRELLRHKSANLPHGILDLYFEPLLARRRGGPACVKRVTTLRGYDVGTTVGRVEAKEKRPRNKREIIELLKAQGETFAA